MSTYYWDIGFDLNSQNVTSALVEGYTLSPGGNGLATNATNTVFYQGDQVKFNLFNISSPTVNVSNIKGQIEFTNAGCPFSGVSSPIQFEVSGIGEPGQSAAFLGATYYPHWMIQENLQVSCPSNIYSFTVYLTVTTADGATVSLQTQDPEMIVGSAG